MAQRITSISKRLGSYGAAAGAAIAAGTASEAEAVRIIYDTTSAPITLTTDYFAYGVNMGVINPFMAGAPDSSGAAANGLIGIVVDDTGGTGNGVVASAPSDGAVTTSSVFFRYNYMDDHSGSDKSGTQFGVLSAPGNGVYGLIDTASAQPADSEGAGTNGYEESEIIGEDYLTGPDVLLTGDTNPVVGPSNLGDFPLPATVVDMDGHGAGGSGWSWDIVTGVRYLGFQLDGRNGFVKVNETSGRNSLQILGWGIETVPGCPILTTVDGLHIGPGCIPVPEPSTLTLLAIGATGLLAARRLRRRNTKATQAAE